MRGKMVIMFKAAHIAQKGLRWYLMLLWVFFVEIRQLDRLKMHFDVIGDGLLYTRFSDIARKSLNFGIEIEKSPKQGFRWLCVAFGLGIFCVVTYMQC